MENKKLLKFLFKDIAEIEEMFAEKGNEGFDDFEIEFIQSRFKGAKQIIRMLDEKEVQGEVTTEKLQEIQEKLSEKEPPAEINLPEAEEKEEPVVSKPEEKEEVLPTAEEVESEKEMAEEIVDKNEVPEEANEEPLNEVEEVENEEVTEMTADASDDMELDEETEENGSRTIGDSFLKGKSVNDLMNNGSGKLETKLSNSPVASIRGAIGINDRYQYIRELFDGSADTFSKTVDDLDNLNTIQEAVSYLQQNYKWKKNETSLKFVNLVKRRFANG